MLYDLISSTESKKSSKAPESLPAATFSDPLAKRKKPSGARGTLWHPISEESSEEDSPPPPKSPKPSRVSDGATASDAQPPSPRTVRAIQAALMDSGSEEELGAIGRDAPRSPWGDMSPRTMLAIQEAMQEEQEMVPTETHKPPMIDLSTSKEPQHQSAEPSVEQSSLPQAQAHHSSAAVYISSSDEEMDVIASDMHVRNGTKTLHPLEQANKTMNSQQHGGVLSLKTLCTIQRSSMVADDQTSSTDKEKMVGDKSGHDKEIRQGDSGIVEDSIKTVMSRSLLSSSTPSDVRDTTITSSDSESEPTTASTLLPSGSFLSERHAVTSPALTSMEGPGRRGEVPQGNGQEIKSDEEEEEEGRSSQDDVKIETSDESSTEGMAEFIFDSLGCLCVLLFPLQYFSPSSSSSFFPLIGTCLSCYDNVLEMSNLFWMCFLN